MVNVFFTEKWKVKGWFCLAWPCNITRPGRARSCQEDKKRRKRGVQSQCLARPGGASSHGRAKTTWCKTKGIHALQFVVRPGCVSLHGRATLPENFKTSSFWIPRRNANKQGILGLGKDTFQQLRLKANSREFRRKVWDVQGRGSKSFGSDLGVNLLHLIQRSFTFLSSFVFFLILVCTRCIWLSTCL